MVSLAAGKVVLVPFPFSDLSQSKLRPAVVLADAGRNDWILCQITSKPYGAPHAIVLRDESFSAGGLQIESFARPGKLFTANSSRTLVSRNSLNCLHGTDSCPRCLRLSMPLFLHARIGAVPAAGHPARGGGPPETKAIPASARMTGHRRRLRSQAVYSSLKEYHRAARATTIGIGWS